MKIRFIAILAAATASFTASSSAATIGLAAAANSTVGMITIGADNVSGEAVFVSTTTELTGISAAMQTLLASSMTTPADFQSTLATLIGSTSSTSPGIVRNNVAFAAGVLQTNVNANMGSVGNFTYLFLVGETGGFVTGIGSYAGRTVPALGAIMFNPLTSNDTPGVGTSVFGGIAGTSGFQLSPTAFDSAAVPEPSAALLGALGVLSLLRRRRI